VGSVLTRALLALGFKAAPKLRQTRGKYDELAFREGKHIESIQTLDGGIALGVVEQRYLTKKIATLERGDSLLISEHLHLAAQDDVDAIADVALAEEFLSGLEVLLGEADRACEP